MGGCCSSPLQPQQAQDSYDGLATKEKQLTKKPLEKIHGITAEYVTYHSGPLELQEQWLPGIQDSSSNSLPLNSSPTSSPLSSFRQVPPGQKAKTHFNAERKRVRKSSQSSISSTHSEESESGDPNRLDFLAASPFGQPIDSSLLPPSPNDLPTHQDLSTQEAILQQQNFVPPKAAFVVSKPLLGLGGLNNTAEVVTVADFNFSLVWQTLNGPSSHPPCHLHTFADTTTATSDTEKPSISPTGSSSSSVSNIEDLQGFQEFETRLRKVMVPTVHKAGDFIIRQGDIGHEMYFLVSGKAEAVHLDEEGKPTLISYLGPGTFFGEMGILFQVPRTAAIRAVENCISERLSKSNLDAVLVEFPDIAAKFKAVAKSRLKVAREAKLHQRRQSVMETLLENPEEEDAEKQGRKRWKSLDNTLTEREESST